MADSYFWCLTPSYRHFDASTFPYIITDKQLGSTGQYAKVWLCKRRSDGAPFAIKAISKIPFTNEPLYLKSRFAEMIESEIYTLQLLRGCANIVQYEDHFEDSNHVYIVTELLNGDTLFQHLVSHGRMPETTAVVIMRQILSAVQQMHALHVGHFDLKPENIMLHYPDGKQQDAQLVVKLIDFGMVRQLLPCQYATRVVGTPCYMAPEVIRGKYDLLADMWSLGVIMFFLLHGYMPFAVESSKFKKDAESERLAVVSKVLQGFQYKILDVNKYGFGPFFPNCISTSKDAKHLVGSLLQMQPKHRLSCNLALQHPWLSSGPSN